MKRFFPFLAPASLASVVPGVWVVTRVDLFSRLNAGRGHATPNMMGFVLVLALLVWPAQVFFLRFEKVAQVRGAKG